MSCSEERINFNRVREAAFDILFTCFMNNDTNVIIIGDIDDNIIKYDNNTDIIFSKVMFNPKIKFLTKHFTMKKNVPVFFIITNTIDELKQNILFAKKTKYWDVEQFFFVISNDSNCDNANNYLRQTWFFNILNSFYICYDKNNNIFIYTFNPFVDMAPKNWKLVKNSNDKQDDDDAWTIFNRQYKNEKKICVNMIFDKTANLNGYKVKAAATEIIPYLNMPLSKNNFNDLIGHDGFTVRTIFQNFNVNIILTFSHDGIMGRIGTNGTRGFGILQGLSDGIYDIILGSSYMYSGANTTISPPHSVSGISIIAHPMLPKSTTQKIIEYLGYKLIFVTILITILSVIILYIFGNNQSIVLTTLEGVRLLSNGSILKLPSVIQVRIIMSTIFLFFLIFQSIFQGKLAALLTHQVPNRILETQDDLINHPEYKIYVPASHKVWLADELQKRTIDIPEITCINRILNDKKSVCISDTKLLQYYTARYNLYMSRVPIRKTYSIYRMRNDWPLRGKFVSEIMRVKQTGLYEFWEQKASNFSNFKIINEIDKDNKSEFTTVKLSDIDFSFKILLVGLSIAILTFLNEIKFLNLLIIKLQYIFNL
ncbi:hypothetical protein HCN44_007415 [Aphidius gifuensis]|uniref:Ionotropic receptor n=1 Tax=Aphidius gifuensis TaxID=684658 RepID=A0A835CQE7_APHGI|nr:hypothetical protein HCN44_007415 [Aphidius gifuensis]